MRILRSIGGSVVQPSASRVQEGMLYKKNLHFRARFLLVAGVGLSVRLKCLKIRCKIVSTFDVFHHFVSKYWR